MDEKDIGEDRVLGDVGAALTCIPMDRPVAYVFRHSDREGLGMTQLVEEIPLTPLGIQRAGRLGALLGEGIRRIHASPLDRCVQTAVLVREGAQSPCSIELSTELGGPGCFVIQEDRAGESLRRLGVKAVFEAQLRSESPLGFRGTSVGVGRLLSEVFAPERALGLHIWNTHDSILGIFLGYCLGLKTIAHFPAPLEGAWLWEDKGDLMLMYRREVHRIRLSTLPPSFAFP